MGKRILDGEALWSSTKLARCSLDARKMYPWLLPLADAAGCFEITSLRSIYGRVGSIIDDLTEVKLLSIFQEYQKHRLLFVWNHASHLYAFWVGIDKPGRLPPNSKTNPQEKTIILLRPLDLYNKYLAGTYEGTQLGTHAYAFAFPHAYANAGESTPLLSYEKPNQNNGQEAEETDDDMHADGYLTDRANYHFLPENLRPDKLDKQQRLVAAALLAKHGRERLEALYDQWVEDLDGALPKKPVADFLAAAPRVVASGRVPQNVVSEPVPVAGLKTVLDFIGDLSDSRMSPLPKGKSLISSAVELFGPDVVMAAAKAFWDQCDDFGQKRARQEFPELCDAFCGTEVRRRSKALADAEALEAAKQVYVAEAPVVVEEEEVVEF